MPCSAVLQQISKHRLENKKWKGGGNIAAEMIGYANFVVGVKPVQGQKMKAQLQEIFSRPDIQQQLPKQEWRNAVSPAKKTHLPHRIIKMIKVVIGGMCCNL